MIQKVRTMLIAAWLALPGAGLADTGWFMHEFGELRSYHGDFLNVCADAGNGPCRTVNYVLTPGDTFFGKARLALHRMGDGWAVEIWDQALPTGDVAPFQISVDGTVLTTDPAWWSERTPDGILVAQTLSLTDPGIAAPVIDALRRGFFLTVRHEAGETVFSLRGLIAAQNAIDNHLRKVSK